MKAIVQTGAETVEYREQPRPTPEDDEVLVEVRAAGLCGSDAHAYLIEGGYEWIKLPRIMGHEYAGVVRAVGADVIDFEPGERVVEEPIHDCGTCFQCQNGQPNVCQDFSITGMHTDGAYGDFTTVPARHLHHVPDSIPFEHAAITEPTSIATRAVIDQSHTQPGDRILVEGPGPIGTLTALVADSMGASVLVSGLDRDASDRLPLLEQLGIETINCSEDSLEDRTDECTDGRGFDIIFDTTGHHSGVEQGVDVVRKGGQIVVVGLPGEPSRVDMTPLVRGEVDLNTSYGSTWRNFEQALRVMQNGTIDFDAVIDTGFDRAAPADAFEAFLNAEVCKPVFRFNGTGEHAD